jgi:hypothetical protein
MEVSDQHHAPVSLPYNPSTRGKEEEADIKIENYLTV